MQKVVEFLQANPVQYLATVGRDGKAKCRPCSVLSRMEIFGSAPTTQRMYIRIYLRIRKLKYLFLLRNTHGFVFMVRRYSRTT